MTTSQRLFPDLDQPAPEPFDSASVSQDIAAHAPTDPYAEQTARQARIIASRDEDLAREQIVGFTDKPAISDSPKATTGLRALPKRRKATPRVLTGEEPVLPLDTVEEARISGATRALGRTGLGYARTMMKKADEL